MGALVVALHLPSAVQKGPEPLWQLLARSDAVVEAELRPSWRSKQGTLAGLELHRIKVIVGDNVGSQLSVTLQGLSPKELRTIQRLVARRVIVFLGSYDKAFNDLKLAAPPASALREATPRLLNAIQQAARANEAAFLRAKRKGAEYCKSGSDLRRGVRDLVARLGGAPEEVTQAIDGLLRIGGQAVPYIICELESAREPISARSVRVSTGQETFEAHAHYTPEEKIDLLDLVLTRLTGVSFGSIANGATPAQRERAIRGWWVYLGRSVFGGEQPTAR